MEARLKLQNTKLKKSGKNTYADYEYFELADFLPAVQTIFNDLGLCGVVSYAQDVATLTITDVDDNSSIEIKSPMAEANLKGCHPIQNLGAVETYTRRYLWVTAMEIVEHDALDASEPIKHPLAPKESAKSIAKSVWDEQTPEEQAFLTNIAMDIVDYLGENDVQQAHKLFYMNNLDNEQQVALWSRLDSKQRKTIKDYNDTIKKAS